MGRVARRDRRMRVGDDGPMALLHREEWLSSADRPVRSLVAGTPVPRLPRVVIVPGLGAIGYLLDLLHACGAWTQASLLDLPGFGNRVTSDCPADLDTLTPVAAGCLGTDDEPPLVLVGHSTGAQLALRAAAAAPDLSARAPARARGDRPRLRARRGACLAVPRVGAEGPARGPSCAGERTRAAAPGPPGHPQPAALGATADGGPPGRRGPHPARRAQRALHPPRGGRPADRRAGPPG